MISFVFRAKNHGVTPPSRSDPTMPSTIVQNIVTEPKI